MSRHEVFPNPVAGEIWRERWCGTCFQQGNALQRLFQHGPGCQALAQALGGTVPPQWTRGRDSGMAADLPLRRVRRAAGCGAGAEGAAAAARGAVRRAGTPGQATDPGRRLAGSLGIRPARELGDDDLPDF